MEISNIQKSNNKADDLISTLEELENSNSPVKFDKAVAIAKDLINQNKVLANEKEEWEKEKKRLTEELVKLNEQLKILRAREYGKSSEKVKKQIKDLEQKRLNCASS